MPDYTLTRSKRRTIAIHIRDGFVEVRAPLKTSKREIDRFVASKEKWIADKLSISCERLESREMFTLAYGDTVILRGTKRVITPVSVKRAGFDGEVFYIPGNLQPTQIKSVCVQIYRR